MTGEQGADAEVVRLSSLTTFRVGGPARRFVTVTSDEQFVDVVRDADGRGEPVLIVAGGSNLLVADAGFDGLVVKVATRGVQRVNSGADGETLVTAAAGEPWDVFVAAAVGSGLAGIETLSGIPGSVGATPVQNVGAYGSDVAQVIASVRVYDRQTGEQYTVDAADCDFGYRDSRFKRDPQRWLILDTTVRLQQSELSMPIAYTELANELGVHVGEQAKLVHVRRAVLHLRRGKGMVLDLDDHDSWSAGSFFTNPIVAQDVADRLPSDAPRWPVGDGHVKLSAGWLIEQAGFGKGWSVTPDASAALSSKHTLALSNRGGASCADVVDLGRAVRDGVHRRFGVWLVPEPTLVGCSL